MANDPMTGFFSLPRELRDEIYRYILVLQPPASKYTPTSNPESCSAWESPDISGPPIEFQFPRRNLSLLRVCRRLYAEALSIFYGENVFSILVHFRHDFIDSSNFITTVHSYWTCIGGLRITHYAPWEQLGYIYPDWSRPYQCRKYQPLRGPQQIGTPFQPTETMNSMATVLRDGHLIRHLRIHCDVIDMFPLPDLSRSEYTGSGNHVLSHLAARIQAGTPNAFKEITVQVGGNVIWGVFDNDASMIYRSIVNLVWPLTATGTGGYRIRIMTNTDFIEASHPGEEDELLAKCRRDAQVREEEEDFVNIPVEEGSHWAISDGKLVVQADEALLGL